MRKIIALIMASVIALSFAACDSGNTTPPATEQQKEKIRKAVPPVRSELYDEYNSKLADIDYEYDDNGNCLSHTVTWTDYYGGDVEKTVYTYDDRGNIVHKETSYSYRENYTYNEYFVYDEENRLIEENWGSDFRHIYEYDSDGHLARKMNKNEDGTTENGVYVQVGKYIKYKKVDVLYFGDEFAIIKAGDSLKIKDEVVIGGNAVDERVRN